MCVGNSPKAQQLASTPGGPVLKYLALNIASQNGNPRAQMQLDQMRATMRQGMAARRAVTAPISTTGGPPSVTGG